MQPQPYDQMSDYALLSLCLWREAEGESIIGKKAVAWCIKNRVDHPGWWGHSWSTVILKPFQFSSFNKGEPREKKWPDDNQPAFSDCCEVATRILNGTYTQDPTFGAGWYYDVSISFPKGWGSEGEYENTANIGHFRFWKMKPPVHSNHDTIAEISSE